MDDPKKWKKFEASSPEGGAAIDDSEDLDDDFVSIHKTLSASRRRESKEKSRMHKVLGFPFLPNIRPLTISDLESCVALEDAAFTNPDHRCSREKFEYRLSICSEQCMGIFCSINPNDTRGFDISTLKTAHAVETGRNDGAVSVLFAHIVATRCDGDAVTDKAMDYPRDFRTKRQNTTDLGHQEGGDTIAIHSLAVHPKLQGCGLGKLIMKSYMDQIKTSGFSGRIALICQDYLIGYYKSLDFTLKGPSQAVFGGGGWHDMVYDVPAKKK